MNWRTALTQRWATLAERERRSLALAAAVVVLALLWWVGIAPALRTLRAAEQQQPALDAQMQKMLSLQAQAQSLKAQPKLSYDDALRTLEASLRQRLGSTAQLNVVAERATVTLKGAAPEALAQWLAQARINARALPTEARLTRNPGSASAAVPAWDGTLVLALPAR